MKLDLVDNAGEGNTKAMLLISYSHFCGTCGFEEDKSSVFNGLRSPQT